MPLKYISVHLENKIDIKFVFKTKIHTNAIYSSL